MVMEASVRSGRTTHVVDATLFYTPTSGGVRRYLLCKHDWLTSKTRVKHSLVVPGPEDRGEAGGLIEFRSPPLRAGYRCPLRMSALRRTLRDLAPSLIEAGDPYVVGWQVGVVAERYGIPAVAFCHSDIVNVVQCRFGGLAAAATGAYLRLLYGRYDRVLAPSEIVANHLADAGIHDVVLQPLGVDADIFLPDRREPKLRERLNVPPSTRLLVFAGRLAPEKNLGDLEAMVDLLGDPYHLLVIGGETAGRPSPRVSVLPYERDPRAVAALIGGCDAFVHAGRQETFGLVALEAMACGVPVAAYRAGALAELVDDDVGALASHPSPAGLADAVQSIFARDSAALGRQARRRVLLRHSWDAAFRQLLRTYAEVLREPVTVMDAEPLSAV